MNKEQLPQSISIDLSQQQRFQYLAQSNYFYKDQKIQKMFFQEIRNNLKFIINEKDKINQQFNDFKEAIICQLNMTMGKIASSYHKTIQQKNNLEEQLKKAKQSHKKMKMQVIQLRQMIDEFLKSYNKEVSLKDKEIQQLKTLLEKSKIFTIKQIQSKQEIIQKPIDTFQAFQNKQNGIFQQQFNKQTKFQKSYENYQKYTYSPAKITQQSMIQLDPIQQQSERTVSNSASHIETLRQVPSQVFNQQLQLSSKGNSQKRKSKNFIESFRNSLTSSFIDNNQQQNNKEQYQFKSNKLSPSQNEKMKITLQKDVLINIESKFNQQVIIQGNKNNECCQLSKNSSYNNLTSLGNTNKINIPLKSQSPKGIDFINKKVFKEEENKKCQSGKKLLKNEIKSELQQKYQFVNNKKQEIRHRRFMTEESNQDNRQNISIHIHLTPISLKAKSRVLSNEKISLNKSVLFNNNSAKKNQSCLKQKLKVFSKNKLQQDCHINDYHLQMRKSKNLNNNFYLNSHRKNKSSVHLGNKNYLNKIKKIVKDALKKYQFKSLTKNEQLFYKGEYRDQKRNGFGKLHYQNGVTYQGHFANDMKNGQGKLFINGNQAFDGYWQDDRINGQGSMRGLQLFTQSCQQCLKGSAYLGQFSSNKFHGIGTLYLLNKQKIVTKFASGIPYGQFTLYSSQNVQFGVWLD